MDLFHLLGSGAKFDKNRFKQDVGIFEGEKEAIKSQSKKRNAAAMDANVRSQLLDEIDFFKTTHTVIEPRTKAPKEENDSSSEEEEMIENERKKAKENNDI
ncbi:hypothetical protein BY458DRAFT_561086 [Sporodiniella umbellata]|nr:hypothetical protein BY458DRAFT_561086 [Sporodiniella umbellata]